MRPLLYKIKPTNGFASYLHLFLVIGLPVILYILVSFNFVQLALSVIVLSKWRMFAVKPRFWASNVRANSIDLMVGLSVVAFMAHGQIWTVRAAWMVLYALWLLFIKPASSNLMIILQAFIGQICALTALYLVWSTAPDYALTFLTGLFCFLAARHFLENFDEPYARMLSYIWGYFGAALAWLLSHWLLFYHGVSQVTLILSVLGYGMGVLYYLDHYDKLNKGTRNQLIFVMVAVVMVVLVFSHWGNKVY